MDQKRLLTAIVISIAILVSFQWLMPRRPRRWTPRSRRRRPRPRAPTGDPAAPGTQPTAAVTPPAEERNVPRLAISAPKVQGSVNLVGARLDDLVLRDYREEVAPNSPLVRLLEPRVDPQPYYTQFGWTADGDVRVPNDTTTWTASAPTLTVSTPVVLTWDNGAGQVFAIKLSIDDDYMFTAEQSVRNTGAAPVAVYPWARIRRDYKPVTAGYYILHEGLLGVLGGVLQEQTYDKANTETAKKTDGVALSMQTTGGWAGITDKYWLTALIPDQAASVTGTFRHVTENGSDRYQVDFAPVQPMAVAPGSTGAATTRLFAGAKVVSLLDRYEGEFGLPHFDKAVDFGYFYWLTKPIFYALDWLYRAVGNFGIAIMIFTVFVKLLFFPLANKSYRSMSKMKDLSPRIAEIRERNKDDPQKTQSEIMGVYKTSGVNPVSGCLPMVLQIPVFFSLYKVIFITIEMRQAPFFGWIHDLSAVDPTNIFNLFGLIPFDPAQQRGAAAPRHLAHHHGGDDVLPAAAEPAAARPRAGEAVPVHAADLHLHAGALSGRVGDILVVEQHTDDLATMDDHAPYPPGDDEARAGPDRPLGRGGRGRAAAVRGGVPVLLCGAAAGATAAACVDGGGVRGAVQCGEKQPHQCADGKEGVGQGVETRPGAPGNSTSSTWVGGWCWSTCRATGMRRRAKEIKADWQDMMFDYLRGRPVLRRVVLLLDARIELKASDTAVMDLLDQAAVTYQLVLTKADSVRPTALGRKTEEVRALAAKHPAAYPHVLATSSETGLGIEALRAMVASLAT